MIKRANGSPTGTSGSTISSGSSTTCAVVVVLAGVVVLGDVEFIAALSQHFDEFVRRRCLGPRVDEVGDEQLIKEEQANQESRCPAGSVLRLPDTWLAYPLSPAQANPGMVGDHAVIGRSIGAPASR